MCAKDVRWHEIRGKLYSGELRLQDVGQCLAKECLAQPRDTLYKHVSPCKESHQQESHHFLLAYDHL